MNLQEPLVANGSATFNGPAVFNSSLTLPASAISNNSIIAGANVAASKLQHRHTTWHQQVPGSDVVAETRIVYFAHATGVVKAVRIRLVTPPAAGDKTVTLDVQKAANGSNTWATILTTPLVFNTSSVAHTVVAASLVASPALVTLDALRLVITVAGSSGTQAQGIIIRIDTDENAD